MPAAEPEPPPRSRTTDIAAPDRAIPATLDLLLEIDDDAPDDDGRAKGDGDGAHGLPGHDFLHDWARHALDATREGAVPFTRAELSMRLVGADAMRALNRDWRGRDAPTNVLSFPSGLPVLGGDPDGASPDEIAGEALLALGDVALCPTVVREEARVQGKATSAHWAHLVVHGVLHLRGFDHESEADAGAMEALETRLLTARGLPDPYAGRDGP